MAGASRPRFRAIHVQGPLINTSQMFSECFHGSKGFPKYFSNGQRSGALPPQMIIFSHGMEPSINQKRFEGRGRAFDHASRPGAPRTAREMRGRGGSIAAVLKTAWTYWCRNKHTGNGQVLGRVKDYFTWLLGAQT